MAVSGLLTLTVPLLLAGVGLCGVLTGTDVFSALTDGARDGLKTVMRIFPALVALLTAVSMLRASGALEALTRLCAPILARLGIPPETAMLLLVRPISGSGALAAASDIIQTYGADSRIGRTAAVMLGSTETTFYVLAVYFGACGIRHSRWAIPAAIVADVTGFVTAAALVRRVGTAEAAYFADPGEYELLSLSERLCRSLADKSLERAERILGDCDRLGVTLLTYQDAAYPERLLQLHDFPLVLYVKGRLFRFDEELAVAIVGSRECTPYGVAMAGRLGLELARSGALVLSGLAQGIDAAALKGALQGGGPAVSVLAGGVDVVYPRRNQGLYEDVAAAGAILSENPPGTPPEGWRFPIRNRILSGLSAGVAAVEAAEHSGTLITARLALDQNREVFAVPGPADAPMSAGTNGLIARGEAKLIRSAQDILVEYVTRFPHKVRQAPSLSREGAEARLEAAAEPAPEPVPRPAERNPLPLRPRSELEAMGDEQRAIFALLSGRALVPDEIVGRTEIPARRVNTALTLLQAQGYLNELPGKRFTAAVRFDD